MYIPDKFGIEVDKTDSVNPDLDDLESTYRCIYSSFLSTGILLRHSILFIDH